MNYIQLHTIDDDEIALRKDSIVYAKSEITYDSRCTALMMTNSIIIRVLESYDDIVGILR